MQLIGIAGGSASGKTTATTAWVKQHPARIACIAHDCYYLTLSEERRDSHGRPEAGVNFDEPASLDNTLLVRHLDALARGKTIRVPDYDFRTSRRTGPETWSNLDPTDFDVIVVEGILTLATPDLLSCFHQTAFFDTPADIRLARRLLRDVAQRGHGATEVVEQYLATVRPMHEKWVQPCAATAQHCFDGTLAVEQLVTQMNERLRV